MNEHKVAVLTDSSSDIAPELIRKYDIKVLPLHVMYPEKDYADGVDIDPLMTYERFEKNGEFPNTSTPSLQEVMDMIESIRAEGYEKIIAVSISSGLSSTCNTIRLAAEEFEDEMDIFVFDSRNVSVGTGVLVIWAAWRLHEGADYEEVCRGLTEKIYDSKVMFYMDTLTYLLRGGRVGKVSSVIGQALKLKPIISCNEDGIYYTVAMIRGARAGKKKLLEEVLKFIDGHRCWIIIGHGGVPEEAEQMKQMLMDKVRSKRILYVKQITATMAVNTGPGLVGVLVLKEP